MIIEVCANSVQSALNAQDAGADRIELCSELGVGGITPSYAVLRKVREQVHIPVHVLIRPRSGDFTYSDVEFEIMKEDIMICRDLEFDGIVSGILTPELHPDLERTAALRTVAGPMTFTFHRAFDWVKDPLKALQQLEDIGINGLLTSGQQVDVWTGRELLLRLLASAQRVTIIPGGGVNQNNVSYFKDNGFDALHFSATSFQRNLAEIPPLSMYSSKFFRDDTIAISDPETIRILVDTVK